MSDLIEVPSGLEGVIAFETSIAEPDKEGGMPGSKLPSTSRPQTFSKGTLPTSSSMSTPR